METGNSTYFIITWVGVGTAVLFGLGLLFVRAARIERSLLVGLMTIATALIAGFVLSSMNAATFGAGDMVSLLLVAFLGFGVGWAYDALMGPLPLSSRDEREATLGSDLAD